MSNRIPIGSVAKKSEENYSDICSLNMYLPDVGTPFPVFIHFHGGGLENGSKDDVADLLDITSKGIALISVGYRKYPDAVYPEFIEDAAKAIAFIKEYDEKHNLFSSIYVGGTSAGAYLAMMNYFDDTSINIKDKVLPRVLSRRMWMCR